MEDQQHSPGQIVRIRLINFMTYKSLDLRPTPGLNLLIGPNGSGKSSIMCAICLGLAGKPAFTGRQIRLSEYIAHGSKSAAIELELCNSEGRNNIIIRREIKQDGKSDYMLNKQHVREQEVERVANRFNIQVNNLCQFLPQEKVADFARMNSKQLLESMQQAIGDKEMHGKHKELISMRKEIRQQESECKSLRELIDKEKEKNERLQSEVDIYSERESYLEKISRLEKCIPFMEYGNIFKLRRKQKEIVNNLMEKKCSLQDEMESSEANIEQIAKPIAELEAEVTSQAATINKLNLAVSRNSEEVKNIDEAINDLKLDLQNKITAVEQQEDRVQEIKAQIAAHENECRDLAKKIEYAKPRIDAGKQEKKTLCKQILDTSSKRADLSRAAVEYKAAANAIYQELIKFNDIQHKKMQALLQLDKDTYEALMWLKQNEHMFRKKVYDPVVMLIETPNANDAKFLENHIGFRDMIVFLCEDKEDSKKFTRILREEKRLAVNVAPVPSRPLSSYTPQIPLDELRRKYHFTNYLKNLFKAPEAVVTYLCDLHNIHGTPCGDHNTEEYLRRMPEGHPFHIYYTPDFKYKCTRSLYGNRNRCTVSISIKEKRILFPTEDAVEEKKKAKKKEFEEFKAKVDQVRESEALFLLQERTLSIRLEQLRKEEQEFLDLEKALCVCQANLKEKVGRLNVAMNTKIDIGAEKEKAAVHTMFLNSKKREFLGNLRKDFENIVEVLKSKVKTHIRLMVLRQNKRLLVKAHDEDTARFKKKEHECEEAVQKFHTIRRQLKEQLNVIEKVFGMKVNEEQNIPKVSKQVSIMIKGLPVSLEEMESEVTALKARVRCMAVANQDVGTPFFFLLEPPVAWLACPRC